MYDTKFLDSEVYDGDNMKYESAKIIYENEVVKSIVSYNKDNAGNLHFSRKYHHVRQGTTPNK